MASEFRAARKWITNRVAPDYTHQLDLFSEAAPETSPPVAPSPARTTGLRPARPRPQQLGFEVWEPLAPFEAAAVSVSKPVVPDTAAEREVTHAPSPQPENARHGESSLNTGTIEKVKPAAGRVLDIEPEERPSRDFRITPVHRIGQGSLHEKARDNLASIRLLKMLEAENRAATDNEKAVLCRYVGWGALSSVFGLFPPEGWRSTAGTLRELLTGPEFESARASTPNAHYTSPIVIEAIWSALRRFGLGSGAQILEPAMGVGHFFGLMPESMQGAHRTGVELDSITARVARKLYPDSTIFEKGFEDTPLPDSYFDAVVGNVPFG